MKSSTLLLFIAMMLWTGIGCAGAQDIIIRDPRIPEAPPVAKAMAAYMTIANTTIEPRRLLSASSPDFKQIEIHQTAMHNGMAHMAAQPNLPIPANSTVVLEPGGLHLMLMQPVRPLKEGDSVALQLRFDDSSTLEVRAPVIKRAPRQP